MKTFKFKFTKTTAVLIYVGIALAAAAIIVNTVLLIFEKWDAANIMYPILQYSLMYFVGIALLIILLSLNFSSYYSIDGNTLKTSFGIIKSKYDIRKIEKIILDRTTNKLSVYFDNQSFIVIAVKDEWYEDFTEALLNANPKIEFSIMSKESDNKNNGK